MLYLITIVVYYYNDLAHNISLYFIVLLYMLYFTTLYALVYYFMYFTLSFHITLCKSILLSILFLVIQMNY